jgi:hypothetical protein
VRRGERGEALRLAFSEFLFVPLLVVLGLVALGVVAAPAPPLQPGLLRALRRDQRLRAAAAGESGRRERQRHIDHIDANYGIQQLADIDWSSVSSAKQSPLAGRLVIANLGAVSVAER